MIRSSQSLMAEDVTVRCTVRRSATPSCKTYYGEGVEMTCTMRNWASQSHRQRQQPQPQQRQRQRQQRRMSTGMNLHSSFSLPKDYSAATATASNTVEEHHHNSGPELLMTKIEEYRDDSPMRHRRQQRRRSLSTTRAQSVSPLERISQYSIPIDDLLLVETTATATMTNKKKSKNAKSNNNSSSNPLLYLSTISNGSFEFSGLTANGYDILLVFLRASIPADRILELQQEDDDNDDEVIGQQAHTSSSRRGSSNILQQSNNYCDNSTLSSSFSCMDVDTLQDKHLQGRANAETLPEKVSRRVAQILNNLSDLSETVCERGLCCGRDGPPPTCSSPICNDTIIMTPKYALDALEMDENTTTTSSQKTPTNMNNEQQQQNHSPNQTTTTTTKTHPPHPNSNHHHQQPPQPKRASIPNLPSGLSVEHHDSGVSL